MSLKQILYLRTILLLGVPFGVGMSIYDYISDSEISIWKFLFLTLFFGGTIAMISVPIHLARLKNLGIENITKKTKKFLKLNQEETIQSDIKINDLLLKLKNDSKFKNSKIIYSGNKINFKTKINDYGWGEKVEINFDENNKGNINISSKPIFPLTLVDFGANLEIVNHIKDLILKTT